MKAGETHGSICKYKVKFSGSKSWPESMGYVAKQELQQIINDPFISRKVLHLPIWPRHYSSLLI